MTLVMDNRQRSSDDNSKIYVLSRRSEKSSEQKVTSKKQKYMNEFWAALPSAALAGSLGSYVAELYELHWVWLGLMVAVIFF